MACSTWASAKWPIRHLAMTGMDTAAMMPSIMSGSLILATPLSWRMSGGTGASASTATAAASSAILAWSGVTTSMITPPLSISAMPRFTRAVPVAGWSCPRGGVWGGRPPWSALMVDTRNLTRSNVAICHDGMASWLEAERRAAVLRDQGVVHFEELGGSGLSRQAQHAGERAVPGLPGRRDHVVVELAGQEHLVRRRLDLGKQFVGAFLAAQRGPEAGLAEGGAQRPGEVALGQVMGPVTAAGAMHGGGQQQAGGGVEQAGGGQVQGDRTAPQHGHVQGGARHVDPGVQPVDPPRPPGPAHAHEQRRRDHQDDVRDHGNSPPVSLRAPWVLPRTTVSAPLTTARATTDPP